MKNNLTLMKSIKGKGEDITSKPLPPGTLYVVCLNKPLIDLWKVNNRFANDYYDASETYFSPDHATLKSSFVNDDRISVMLSLEDEMLLYNEGLTDYY